MLRERKGEIELGAMQGINFWERCYQLTRTIFYNNELKWFHYQVVRGTLKTNYIIARFIPNTTPNCSFCDLMPEKIIHMFYECFVIFDFLQDVYEFFINKWDDILEIPSKKEFIFGNHSKNMWDPINLLSLHVKYFIWVARCRKFIPGLNSFLSWFRFELKINLLSYGDGEKLAYLNDNSYNMEEVLLLH